MKFPFARKKKKPPAVPDGVRVYAIGDIHGMSNLLEKLLKKITKDLKGFEGRAELVFLGDYVDRGPDSAQVIARLCEGPGPGDTWTFLKGNHDAFLSSTMAAEKLKERYYRAWVDQGGAEAMMSWGVRRGLIHGDDPEAAVEALKAAMPKAHRKFFRKLKPSHRIGDYMFVHAGVRPHVPLEEQQEKDLLWIRDDFLDHGKSFGPHIVHGHTITPDVDGQKHRTGVDTGAYRTGTLTALVLEGTERRAIST
ncbi:serine/threonine protein phosphatase [Pacificimonas sp. WHA3]|uniref:Serine/threonine protein phosphatase n=1 Tax=Pacificimonas pallii TaxID=2827236 RepID=A0ABS6SAF0_9SPHN|nr:metallophosphoesterase family protein [Pacificimonas pallii]MBV7255365.1 serine/threonine protein phosphatase [Pacificimonas pallii]